MVIVLRNVTAAATRFLTLPKGQATLFHQYWIQFLGHQKADRSQR